MKRKFTFLIAAALMLLTMMASTGTMWGQTRDTQTVSYGWETTDNATPWTISNAIVATSGEGNTGSYAGRINTNSTTVQFNEKVYVTSFSYAFKRTSNNNNYSVYIETSTDGSTWSIKDTQAMNTFTNGSYRTVTKEFDGSQELYVRFRCNNTTAVRYVDDVTITYATGASQLDPCDLTLTNASTSIVFDLYNNLVPFVINYTTSSTGTVSVAENDYVETVVDQVNKTITVTPIAITNGAKVITVNQAADDNYAAGSKTFTINITDSTPFSGGNVTFDATTDKGTSPLVKNGVTFACTSGVLDNGSEYRLYKNSVTTFSVTQGNITQIAFTGTSSNPASGFGSQTGWTTNGDNGTWTGEATEVSFTASGAQVRATQIIVTVESSSDPAVHTTTTINVPINFNTDIQQGTNAGTLTATVTVTSDGSEVSGATVTWESSNTSVATIDANGAVTLVAVGTTTITASYAGVEDQYKPSEGTYPLTVSDSNAPGTVNNPYTVAAAMAATPASGTSNYVYIHGIVSAFYNTSIVGDGNNYRYYISDDGTTTSQLLVYKGKGLNEVTFSSADDLHIGDIVTIYGGLTMYQSAPEVAANNYIVSLERPAVDVEAPTFSVAAGGYAETQTVAISCATDGAQIYYTTDGSTPDNTKTLYNGAITVSETQTIKAIAYVGENASAISTAAYYILSNNNTYTVAEALAFETYPQNNIFVEGIVSTAPTSLLSGGLLTYYISADGTTTDQLQVYKGKNLGNAAFTDAGEIVAGDRVTVFGNVKIYNNTTEFDQGNYLITLEGYQMPVINANNINIACDATSGTINYTIEPYVAGTMTAETEADWISNFNTNTFGQVSFTTTANDTEEARVATVTLTYQDISETIVNKVVTVTQAPHVNDYAELPFWFNGYRDEIATTDGLTQYGLGEDFGNEPHLNFDNEGDWVILKMNEAPGRVYFTISNEDFSSGTFKVQTSADGETYSDLAVYTEINNYQEETYYNLDENVRYIKWIYTENGNGSVGLGTISVAKFVSPIQVYMRNPDDPSQMIISYTFETSSASYQGLWRLLINNTNIESLDQYSIVFCHSDGTLLEPTEQAPDWLLTNYFTNLQVNEYYATCTYYFTINANTSTSPREAYFRFKCVIDETSYYSLPVTVTQEGYVPQNYTVTFNTNDGEFVANQDFSSTSTNVVEGEHNLPSATKDGYTFMGWSDGTQTYAANAVYNVTANVNFTAQWGSFEWVATALADLTADDVFVIVGNNGDTYAMSNDNGTSKAPDAVAVTIANGKITSAVADTIQWNISGNADDGYTFYPNGDTETWLYCNNANNGLRIGTGDAKHFSLADNGYITITETSKQRYLGIYNSQDWRSYENTTGNIANQTFAFYKRVEALPPSIYLGDDHDIGNHFGTGLVTWEYIDVEQTGLTEDITLTASIGTLSPDQIAAGAGTTEVLWTHTFNETGGFDVTITATSGETETSIHLTGTVRQTYYINTNIAEHGSIDTYVETALQGDHMLFTIIPDEGYMPDEVTVMAGETPVEFSARPHAINQFEFDMPESDVTISVTFKESVYEQYELFSGELVEGDYLIVYNNVAMIADRTYGYNLQYKTVAPENDIISTDNAAMVWHLAPSATEADCWTICNPARDLYLIADKWNENIVFLDVLSSYDDEAVWTVTGTETYEFVNKYAVENDNDANLRYNENVGFSCYSTSVGGALSLYKKVDPDAPSITLSSYEIDVTAEGGDGTLTVTYKNIETDLGASIYWFESDSETPATEPDWISADINETTLNVDYIIGENDGEARTAYFKVYGIDTDGNDVYSDLVTVTQAAAEYTVTFIVADCIHGSTTGSSINLPDESTCTPDGFAIYGWALQNSIEAVANPYMPTADVTLYAILQLENVPSVMEKYVKVTEELTDWSGEYLIVYENEAGNLAFNGSLTTLDAAHNTIEVTITNNTIEAYSTTDASNFTIAAYNNGYSIQSASGKYIGIASNNNGLTSSDTELENSISYNENDEEITIISSGGAYLRYNNTSGQERFRYYKSSSYTNQRAIQLYKKVSEEIIPTIVNVEYVSGITSMPDNIPESTCYVVEDGAVLTFTGTNEGTAANLVVQEGGQLIHTEDVEATIQKGVSGYTNKSGDGWYLISSPVDNLPTSAVATGTYDLFAYDEATAYWWVDHAITGQPANHTFTTLERGKGYLYANAANVNLNYAGTMKATDANITVPLSFACDEYPDLKGFNLVGNPFTRNITNTDMVIGEDAVTSYYDFNADRTEFVTYLTNDRPIQPGQGFFIQATGNDQQLEFNPASSKDASDFKYISISAGDENFTDKAYIQFGYGNTLRKMTFGENTMVYVMNDDDDYAAARVEELAGTIPVHFVPIEDGFYTITVETKNIENLNYMHLIDNIKNTEIDLLVEPSYTFKASESDNADRFYLVFDFNNYTGVNENYTNDNFAHQIGDEIFVSGEGTLQVFDVLGRFVTGYNVNGDKRISTAEFNTGVYIFRMVGTEVKTQKIIVR